MIAITTERLRPQLERTERHLRFLAAIALEKHRQAADEVRPFTAYGWWNTFSSRKARADNIVSFLQRGV